MYRTKNSLRNVIHSGDQSVLVSCNVENSSASDKIRVIVNLSQVCRGFPCGASDRSEPLFQARLRIGVFAPEFFQSGPLGDTHTILGSHNENWQSSAGISAVLIFPVALFA